MKKTFKSVDELAKQAIANKPIYRADEPTVFGNPDTLKKTNQEIECEENRAATKPGKKGSDKHN